MKKVLVSMLSLLLLVCALTGISYGWQGKMAGMGDPYGLVQDESDFLTHPAQVATGEGVRFYGDVRFTYTDVTDWDYNLDQFNTAGTLTGYYHYDTSGDEQKYETLLGSSFPLGAGRMGVFLSYDGMRGDYDGNENILGMDNYAASDLSKDIDNFALRLLYGLPLGGFNLGGEFQLAYRQEETENVILGYLNYIVGTWGPTVNLSPFQLPYDSSYWEALLKGSLEKKVGSLDLKVTLKGGFIFGGDNSLLLMEPSSFGFDSRGTVTGWRIGGEVWTRYPLTDGLTLPFLVRVDHQEKTRDGKEGLAFSNPSLNYPYESQERNFRLEVGGGVDKEFGKGDRIAAGIYYNYLQGTSNTTLNRIEAGLLDIWDQSDYPASTEHRILARFAAERELSAAASLRMGINLFYGRVGEDFVFTLTNTGGILYTDDISLDGNRWGVGASVGGTFVFTSFTLEPFLNAGYQDLDLDGDGKRTGVATGLWKMDKSRSEWFIGGGFSVLFDL